jgi:adenylosuccinate synthase
MSNYIILGAQWGDEGKGKIVDMLSSRMDVVVRFHGGANAGHTLVVNGDKTVLHLVPSGIMSKNCMNIIGNGCAVDPCLLAGEIETIRKAGVEINAGNFMISRNAHIVTPVHKFIDRISGGMIGTTGRGIGPCYADKASRTGIRMEEIAGGNLKERYRELFERHEYTINSSAIANEFSFEISFEKFERDAGTLREYVKDAGETIYSASRAGKNILFEGAQGAFLDIDSGTYPFVTSSNTTIGGAYTGSGVYLDFGKRIAIVKAYATRVGNGPFPTESNDETGAWLREAGHEYGATTGRPRRCGWIDLKMLKRSFIMNGFNYIALTKIDCLGIFDKICAAVDYDGEGLPRYMEFEGWKTDISGVTKFEELPANCRKYIEFIEKYMGVPVGLVSVGPDRNQTIIKEPLWKD